MQKHRGSAFNWIRIVMILTALIIGSHSLAHAENTGDGLSITITGDRVTDLTVESYSVLFSSGETGGFYIRDNTIDPVSGLPQGSTNLLQCPGFHDGVVECLAEFWDDSTPPHPEDESEITVEQPIGSSDFAAKFMIDEVPPISKASWAVLSQVVNLSSVSTTTNDLYYLMFEVATESGWRPYNHPHGHAPDFHGDHKIFARVEWFGSTLDPLPAPQPEPALTALATSTIDCYETTVLDPEGGETPGLTRFCLRTHRPVHPAEAKRARISLWVQGFLPNDGTTGFNDNYVWFDNVYFFKAPDVVQVTGYGAEGNFQTLPGLESLSMWVDITEVDVPSGPHYLLFKGAVQNEDTDLTNNPRAIDLGFALPILDTELGQNVTWWDDARNGTEISTSAPNNWVPYRLTGPVDQRAASNLTMLAESGNDLKEFNTRAANNQISAYPFSVIDIKNSSNGPYGVSFGEQLWDNDNQAPADPQVAHFGYHIEQPSAPFIGKYYVEFNLGLLRPGTANEAETPFSFILFRSDNPASPEESSFRDGTEKYQTAFFPFAFTRPTIVPLGDEWLFGGGIFNPEKDDQGNWWQTGFTKDPNDFGLRYSRKGTTAELDEDLTYGIDNNVRVMIYDRPWTADFEHNTTGQYFANTYSTLQDEAEYVGPSSSLYAVKYDHRLKQTNVNGGISDLFSRGIHSSQSGSDYYTFPVLLADLDAPQDPIIDKLTARYNSAYTNVSVSHENSEGLAGVLYDNVFNDMRDANHLDQDETRLEGYRSAGGAPTYSFNNFMPAIPQLIPNARFLDIVNTQLDTIDENKLIFHWGEGFSAAGPTTEELLSGNIAQDDFGGTKYALMKFGVAGFESNAATAFNSSEESLSFMRAMARDKSMTRQLMEFPCLIDPCEGTLDGILVNFDALGLEDDFIDENQLRIQLVNEATWMTLAWGFHPGIIKFLPWWEDQGDYYNFVDTYLRPLFNHKEPNDPRVGYTHIFDELHLAGWDPVTNVEIDLRTSNQDISELYWERFGGYNGNPGPLNLTYVTVLNNKGLQFTLSELFEEKSSDLPKLKEIKDVQQLIDLNLCDELFSNRNGEVDCGAVKFYERDKYIWVKILDPINMGLWANNIYGVQLLGYYPPDGLCNAPTIVAKSIPEGYSALDVPYSISRGLSPDGPIVRIGGCWPSGTQPSLNIPDKALMVFKLWSSDIAGNGMIGGGGEGDESTTEGREDDDQLISAFYERYGQGWAWSEALGGHEGNTDVVRADSPGVCAYFKIHAGLSGHYQVRVHFPPIAQATGEARYDVFLTDYLLEPAGSADLGEPLFSALVDQSNAEAYTTAREDDGFVTIGELDISVDEGNEVVTVVVKVSAPDGESESLSGSPTLLLADAVRLARIE